MTILRPAFLLVLVFASAARADYKSMDYGPFLNATYTIKQPANNTAYRGTAIGFDIPPGKTIYHAQSGYIFDTELLRPAAWWTGGFVKLDGVAFSGGHGPNPGPIGNLLVTTKPLPGVARGGSFKDPREIPYGPLPRDWARFKGLYRADDRIVFVYTVGSDTVLESPQQETIDGIKILSRTLNLRTLSQSTQLVVADVEGRTHIDGAQAIVEHKDGFTLARVSGIEGAKLVEKEGRLAVEIPAAKTPTRLKISVWTGKEKDVASAALAKIEAPADLAPLLRGGNARWTESVVTQGTLGETGGEVKDKKGKTSSQPQSAYVVDSITPPFKNPYDSWFRIGGFDFFSDGRAAVCTWSGDVWIVSGIDEKLEKITWKRYAAGIFQALGLKIVKDQVHVLSRDGITRLHDLNQDGEADFYECFNNDFVVTANFHEFIYDLHTDPAGNFYFIKGGPVRPGGSGWDRITPHHGCIFKVSPDGAKLEVVARGFRAPNGMGLGPNGEITCGDNQGTWTPVCPINWVKPGGFYGVPEFAGKDPKSSVRDNPLCWLTYPSIDNSNGGQVWITGDKFGPLSGQLLHTSYGQSAMYLVLKEQVGGQMQGGVVPILRFDSGVCRARFDTNKNVLYVTGLRGWQTNASKDAGFYRVRYTGRPLHLPVGLNVTPDSITLRFSDALDTAQAANAENYRLDQWNYRWTSNYGSPQVKVSNPKQTGKDEVEIDSVSVSNDGRSVTLKVPGLRPVMQMQITLNLKAADGTPIRTSIHNTINAVGNLRGEIHVGEFRVVERKD